MNIAFIGTHGTGKTKLAELLVRALCKKGIDAILKIDLTRSLHLLGVPINEEGDIITQILCFSEFYKNIILPQKNSRKFLVCDRSLYDDLAYIECSCIYRNEKEILSKIIETTLIGFWNVIFYVRPKYKMEKDNIRSDDLFYRDEIDRVIFQKVLPVIYKSSPATQVHELSSIGYNNEIKEAVSFLSQDENKDEK